MKYFINKLYRPLAIIAAIIAFGGCGNKKPEAKTDIIGAEVQLTGTIVCLPKKGNNSVTLECAYGIQVDSTYYGLKDLPKKALKNGIAKVGNLVKITGSAVAVGADNKYAITAAIKTETIQLLDENSENKQTLALYSGEEFTISYPEDWLVKSVKNKMWSSLSSTAKGTALAVFRSPSEYLANTNFGYAEIVIGKNDKQKAVRTCLSSVSGQYKKEQVTINGIVYTHITTTDAATGDRYLVNSYRTVREDGCWSIESVLNYSPIEFYGESSGVKVFNRKAVERKINKIIQSFKFK